MLHDKFSFFYDETKHSLENSKSIGLFKSMSIYFHNDKLNPLKLKWELSIFHYNSFMAQNYNYFLKVYKWLELDIRDFILSVLFNSTKVFFG